MGIPRTKGWKWRKCLSVTGSLRGQAQVRPIDKLDEACTNADDRMMLGSTAVATAGETPVAKTKLQIQMLVFSDLKRMQARVIFETDAHEGLFVHQCAQPERPFWRMHATNLWATHARKVWGKSQMRTSYIPDARYPVIAHQKDYCMWKIKLFWQHFTPYHLQFNSRSESVFNLIGLFSRNVVTEHSKRDWAWDLRLKKWHSKWNRLCMKQQIDGRSFTLFLSTP